METRAIPLDDLAYRAHPALVDSLCFRFPIGAIVGYTSIYCMRALVKKRDKTGTRDGWSSFSISAGTENCTYSFVGLA